MINYTMNSSTRPTAPHDNEMSFRLHLLHDQNKNDEIVKYKSHTTLEFQAIVPGEVLPLNIVDRI